MYAGRRTAIDASRLLCGLEGRNRSMELFGYTTFEQFAIANTRSKIVMGALSDDPEHFIPHDVSALTFQHLFDIMEDATDAVKYLCDKRLHCVEYTDMCISDEMDYRITVAKYDMNRHQQRAEDKLISSDFDVCTVMII